MLLSTWLSLALGFGAELTLQNLIWHRGHALFGRNNKLSPSFEPSNSMASMTIASILVVTSQTPETISTMIPIQQRSLRHSHQHPRDKQPSNPPDVAKSTVTKMHSFDLASSIATPDPKPYEGPRQALPDPRRNVLRFAPLLKARNTTAIPATRLSGTASTTITNIIGATGSLIPDTYPSNITGDAIQNALLKAVYLRTAIYAFWIQAHGWLQQSTPSTDTEKEVFWEGSNAYEQTRKRLIQILESSGAPYPQDCNVLNDYIFPNGNVSNILQQGLAVTSWGLSATLDLIQITASLNPDIALELSAILAMDAGHDAYLRQRNGLSSGRPNSGTETRIPADWALTWAHQHVAPNPKCPGIPAGVQPAPPLDLHSPSSIEGTDIALDIGLSSDHSIDLSTKPKVIWLNQLYVPAYSTINNAQDLNTGNRLSTQVPTGLDGTAFIAIVPDNYTFGYPTGPNQQLIAGPAIVRIS